MAKIACGSGNEMCIRDVGDHYRTYKEPGKPISGSVDFQEFVYCTLVGHSANAESVVDEIFTVWLSNLHANNQMQMVPLVKGLACAREEAVIRR